MDRRPIADGAGLALLGGARGVGREGAPGDAARGTVQVLRAERELAAACFAARALDCSSVRISSSRAR